MVERATAKAEEAYAARITRLHALAEENPSIPPILAEQAKAEREAVIRAISQSQLVLDSVRLVFCG